MADIPNILIIMTDQQRADYSREEGFALDTIPAIDRLGREGMRFRWAYTTMPVCVPARCSLFSGRFPKATRVRENSGAKNMFGPPDLVEILKGCGYSINICGKNHSHLVPEQFDFASFYMHEGGGRPELRTPREAEMDQWLAELRHGVMSDGPAPFPVECQPPYRVVRDAVECLEKRDSRPFFLWLSLAEPHSPYQVSEPYYSLFPESTVPDRMAGLEAGAAKGAKWRWLQKVVREKFPGYDENWRRYRANYCGMLRLLDDQIGRFLEYLERTGLREKTIIVFTSDHGDFVGDYGLIRKGVGLPDCLVRVPLIIAGPTVKRAMRTELVSLADVMPTLCEAIGVEIPYGVQGRSLWPMLQGREFPAEEFRSVYAELGIGGLHYGEEERPSLHFEYGPGGFMDELNSVTQSGKLKMVRMDRWKLVFDMMGQGGLFDVFSDPAELQDLYAEPEHAEVKCRLLEELLKWTIRTEDDLPGGTYIPKRAQHNWYS
jgi:arylsulfatase A-like enzyme